MRRFWQGILLTAGGLLALATLLVALVSQKHFLIAPLAYVPKVWAGVALFGLSLLGWRWRPRWTVIGCLSALFYLAVVLEWRTPRPIPAGAAWTVVTVNAGDQDLPSWQRWIRRQTPDLIGYCEMSGHPQFASAPANAAHLPHTRRYGPFALASRFPIIAARSISPRGADGRPALPFLPAVRFEVDFPEGPTAVWVVHVRSPRTDFKKYREWQRWKWIWDRPADLHQRETLQGYWQEQAAAIEYLKSQIAADTLPVLVLGDWNVPDSGPRYAEVTRGLIDAHRAAGTGYGYTFPGDLQVGLAAGRPWMRIDYILAPADAWEVLHCQVQDDAANSQHRAVLARLRRRRPLPKAPPSTPLTAPRAAAAGHLR